MTANPRKPSLRSKSAGLSIPINTTRSRGPLRAPQRQNFLSRSSSYSHSTLHTLHLQPQQRRKLAQKSRAVSEGLLVRSSVRSQGNCQRHAVGPSDGALVEVCDYHLYTGSLEHGANQSIHGPGWWPSSSVWLQWHPNHASQRGRQRTLQPSKLGLEGFCRQTQQAARFHSTLCPE